MCNWARGVHFWGKNFCEITLIDALAARIQLLGHPACHMMIEASALDILQI